MSDEREKVTAHISADELRKLSKMQAEAALMKPWEAEPDHVEFTDEATGLSCVAHRHPRYKNWCGYVGVDKTHPWHGRAYSDKVACAKDWLDNTETRVNDVGVINVFCANPSELRDGIAPIDLLVRCHGGLTYSGKAYWAKEPDERHWFGFDCGHAGDLQPGMRSILAEAGCAPRESDDVYRDLEYVKRALRTAAGDLAKATVHAYPVNAQRTRC